MAMGLKNSPRTMERLVNSLLRNTSSFANSMVDDITISSQTFELHLTHLREILTHLRSANFTASLSKSEFAMKSLTVLGHCIENGEIKPSEKHVEKILKIAPQTTKKGVRALLGMINYHHDMIPCLATITYCFTELLKRDQPEENIRWQQKHTDALEKIKALLISKPILVAPKFDCPFIIMCDATIALWSLCWPRKMIKLLNAMLRIIREIASSGTELFCHRERMLIDFGKLFALAQLDLRF
jgi:hypothetical protein